MERQAGRGARQARTAPKPGDSVFIVVRPEAIQLLVQEPGANNLAGKIRQRVFKGNHTSMRSRSTTARSSMRWSTHGERRGSFGR